MAAVSILFSFDDYNLNTCNFIKYPSTILSLFSTFMNSFFEDAHKQWNTKYFSLNGYSVQYFLQKQKNVHFL